MKCFLPILVSILALVAIEGFAQPQAAPVTTQPATVTLPAQVVVGAPPTQPSAPAQPAGTFNAVPPAPPAPAPAGAAAASPAPPTPTLAAVAPLLPPASECEPLDETVMNKFDAFFLLTRLVDTYTLGKNEAMGPPLNASYAPLTILAPSSTLDFLRVNNINVRELASNPLQTILFAPTLAGHFIRGYYPADALPTNPVPTLCGATCGDVQFTPGNPVTVHRVNMPEAVVNITTPNIAQCPGQWVIHEVTGYLYNNVTDPVAAAAPALDLSYALGGEWDTYEVAGNP
jgi:hypothetical protein